MFSTLFENFSDNHVLQFCICCSRFLILIARSLCFYLVGKHQFLSSSLFSSYPCQTKTQCWLNEAYFCVIKMIDGANMWLSQNFTSLFCCLVSARCFVILWVDIFNRLTKDVFLHGLSVHTWTLDTAMSCWRKQLSHGVHIMQLTFLHEWNSVLQLGHSWLFMAASL